MEAKYNYIMDSNLAGFAVWIVAAVALLKAGA